MVDFEKLMSLSVEEIQNSAELNKLRKAAEEMERLVNDAYTSVFESSGSGIKVSSGEHGKEYILPNGTWRAIYPHEVYEVRCTTNEILQKLVLEYAMDNELLEKVEDKIHAEYAKQTIQHFRAFIERTKKEHPELCHAGEDT